MRPKLSSSFIRGEFYTGYKDVGVRIASFRSSIAHPAYTPIYSLTSSRESAQDSGPRGSLFLSRKNFAFSASCRFYPCAFCKGDVITVFRWAYRALSFNKHLTKL